MGEMKPSEEFASLYTGCQSRLYAFICSLLGSANDAADVLQETNLVLWQKSDEYMDGTDFLAWAFRVAHLQVMAHREKRGRDRISFNDDLLMTLARETSEYQREADDRLPALSNCISKLSQRNQELLRKRYGLGVSVKSLAEELDRSASAVGVTLHRIRAALTRCIHEYLRKERQV